MTIVLEQSEEESLAEDYGSEPDSDTDSEYAEVGQEGPVRFSEASDRSPIEAKSRII